MKYYKSVVSIENGKHKYGNLPEDFIVGYIEDEIGYFALLDTVDLPEDAGVEEITEIEYDLFIQNLMEKENQQIITGQNATITQLVAEKEEKEKQDAELLARIQAIEEKLNSL